MVLSKTKYFWQDGDPLWYKDAIIYELHVRAFSDSNGDGIGDFTGLTRNLDYLQDLGVNTIWLLPFYVSPLKDDGYDIADYTAVHPDYGTIHDFRNFMKEANKRGLRVINELVINHTSDQHPWFQRARNSPPGSRWRNFYVWSDSPEKYKDVRIIFKDFETSNWTWDPVAKAYYWHRFYSHQPDLNFDSAHVKAAIWNYVNFWFKLGVSGLRLDAIPYLYERENTNGENLPETHAYLKQLRQQVNQNFGDRMLLAEANQWAEDATAYFGEDDECHMVFHFPLMPRMFMALRMEDSFPIVDIMQEALNIPQNSQWALFLRNHDELTLEMVTDEERDYMYRVYAHDTQARINLGIRRRLAPLLNNDRRKIELMNSLLLSLPGTPIIYYGDEIGMGDNFYLGDRNGVRTPMQWNSNRNAGFSIANPQKLYLPVNIDPEYHYETYNVETQQRNPESLLWWMKRQIALRKRFRAFGRGSIKFLHPENRKILAFLRQYQDETILVVANLSRLTQHASIDLSDFIGRVPVEVFGQTEFPRICESKYFLSMGPYTFYLLLLEMRVTEQIRLTTASGEALRPQLSVFGEWRNIFEQHYRILFNSIILGYVTKQRWFGGKARHIRSGKALSINQVPFQDARVGFVIFQIDYTEGEPENYLLPVTFGTEEELSKISTDSPGAIIANVNLNDSKYFLYDALYNPDFCKELLNIISRRYRLKSSDGSINVLRTKAFRKLRGSLKEEMEPHMLKAEQSNTSIVYGDRFMLKFYRKLEEGISPELEIGRFLTETSPFKNTPTVAGALLYQNSNSDEPVTMCIMHSFVHNEGDAWHYSLDEICHYFEKVLTYLDVVPPLPQADTLLDIANEELPAIIQDAIGHYIISVRLLAKRTAEMHLALASTEYNPDFKPESFTLAYQRSLFHAMRGFTIQVMQSLRNNVAKLPDTVKADAQHLLSLDSEIIHRFHGVTQHKIATLRTRCHGDYHLGQVLYAGNDYFIIDFEGEPARHLSERRIKHSPLKDVAGMIRSFHYAAHRALSGNVSAVFRAEDRPILEKWAQVWYLWISGAFLNSYLETVAGSRLVPEDRQDLQTLLDTYLLEKGLYELNYEMNNRPEWVELPIQGIFQVMGIKEEENRKEPSKAD